MMNFEKPSEEINGMIESISRKKLYNAQGENMRSEIIGYSSSGYPHYFVRADIEKIYKKDDDGNYVLNDGKRIFIKDEVNSYWNINNPFDPYFLSKAEEIKNLKSLWSYYRKCKSDSPYVESNGLYTKRKLDKVSERTEFLLEPRKMSRREFEDRISDEAITFIKHKGKWIQPIIDEQNKKESSE